MFYSSYGKENEKYYGPLHESSITYIFSEVIKVIDLPIERRKELNQKFIRKSLIKKMFNSGFSLEEIAYLTGLSLGQLEAYISIQDIEEKVNLKSLRQKHPYKKFFIN